MALINDYKFILLWFVILIRKKNKFYSLPFFFFINTHTIIARKNGTIATVSPKRAYQGNNSLPENTKAYTANAIANATKDNKKMINPLPVFLSIIFLIFTIYFNLFSVSKKNTLFQVAFRNRQEQGL